MAIFSLFSKRNQNQKSSSSARRAYKCRLESLENRCLMAGDVANPTIDQAIAGDANLDGAFDSTDLVRVFSSGKYESNQRATWAEGDWNRDGFFDSSDLVSALREGCYGLPAPETQASTPILLSPRTIFDPAFGMNASTVLVPNGWQFDGGVQFGGAPNLLMSGYMRANTPDQTMGVEGYQADPSLTWTVGPLGQPPIGQLDFRGFIFSPPVDGITYFQQNLLPTLRSQHPDYEVLRINREPGLIASQARANAILNAALGGIGARMEFDAVSVQARYRVNGQWIDESFIAQFSYTTSIVGGFTSTDWGLTNIERTFAPSGQLFDAQPLLRTISRSATVNPNWWMAVNSHRSQLHGIITNSQQDFANYIASQNQLELRRDEIHQEFVQFIRGTDVVRNPFTGESSEVASDGSIWFSSTGEVVVNADPNFNPNRVFAGSWRRPG